MLPDQVSNPGPLTYESGTLPIALRGPEKVKRHRCSIVALISICGRIEHVYISVFIFCPLGHDLKIPHGFRLHTNLSTVAHYSRECQLPVCSKKNKSSVKNVCFILFVNDLVD